MKKAERYHLPSDDQILIAASADPKSHGFSGKVNAGYPQPYLGTNSAQRFVRSVQDAVPSIGKVIDLCSGSPQGVGTFSFSILPGNSSTPGGNTRSSSAKAYIYPEKDEKPNLTILTSHLATRIIWATKSENGMARAENVEFISTPAPNTSVSDLGTSSRVGVGKEVIVTSGALGVSANFSLRLYFAAEVRQRARSFYS